MVLMLAIAGCGGSSGDFGTEDLERSLPDAVDESLVELSDVTCVKKSDRSYTCVAMARPTARGIREEYRDYNPGPMSAGDIEKLRRREAQQIGYEVTVDPDTGKFVMRAQ